MKTSKAPADVHAQTGTAIAAVGLGSVTVLTTVGASNSGMWEFSAYLLGPSLIGFLLGFSVILVVNRRRGSGDAAAVAALVGAMITVGGGRLLEPLAAGGIVGLGGLVILTYWAAKRLLAAFNLRWLIQWIFVTLALINGVAVAQIILGEFSSGAQGTVAATRPLVNLEPDRDVAVLVLDELASPITSPLRPADEASLASLEGGGYEVRQAIWSSYTLSAVAIPAILDGRYPLTAEDVLDRQAVLELGSTSRGGNRLVETLKAGGYRFTMIESGLWMTSCGPQVDVCVESQPVDETLGVLLKRSAFRWWYERLWGDAFIASGLHSMTATRRALVDNAENGRPDLTFAHIMLPHIPYLLDEDCQPHSFGRRPYSAREAATAGYRLQAGCVVGWLTETLTELDRRSSIPPVVVVLGDHGTGLAGQLARPPEAWTPEDAAERLAAFGAYRLPGGCSVGTVESTPQVVDNLVACLTGETPSLGRQHFLISNSNEPPDVVEYPATRLDEALSMISPSTS